FDTWINPRGHQGTNDSVSIYNEGLILSLFMDIKLISDTQGEGNYRQLHRLLYERYPVPEKGFSASDVQA
ncbi:MAG: M61 family peptidase, partial [Gammaproteobacteria bacterium]